MQIIYSILLFCCLLNGLSAFWCYHSLTRNLNLIDPYNGTAQLIHGTNDNPCVNGTITKNGVTDNLSTNYMTYKSILKTNFNKQAFPALTGACPTYTPLKSGPNQSAMAQFCTCTTNNCNVASTPHTLKCQSQRKGFAYLRLADTYGQVEECADPNDTCITITGETRSSNISYKGCYGNLMSNMNWAVGLQPLPKRAAGCSKMSFTGYYVTAYCDFCQYSGQFSNVDWTNSEPITCTSEHTGLEANNEVPSTKLCAFNEPCARIIASPRSFPNNTLPAHLMTLQGCSMDLNYAFAQGSYASYPDNQCYTHWADALQLDVDGTLIPTLCSCDTPNCTPPDSIIY
uniref:Uncharacterized protein n=1 Tax=Rhabditophanes sp. KR3021 TaxID=114890 RepID=A0AC35U1B9_9BILA